MKTDQFFKELYKDGGKISGLVRKNHFFTAWKNKDKEYMLLVARNVIRDFNEWKAKECKIMDAFHWVKAEWTKNGGWWEQVEGSNELIRPNAQRLEKDFHLMDCFNKNYKKARWEFVRLIMGDY